MKKPMSMSALIISAALLIVAFNPGLHALPASHVQNGKTVEVNLARGQANISADGKTHSMGFLKETLVLSNDSLFSGDFLEKNNASLEPMFIAYDPVNGNLYVTIGNNGQVIVVNGSTNRIQARINLGGEPFGIAFDPLNQYIYATDFSSRNVSVINPQNNSVITTLRVGYNPYALAFDPQNGNLYVTDSNYSYPDRVGGQGEVSVINSTSDTVVSNFTVGSDPQGIAYDPSNGEMFIAVTGAGYAMAYNFKKNIGYNFGSVTSIDLESPGSFSYNPQNRVMYIGDVFTGFVLGINSSNRLVSSVQEGLPNSMLYNPENGYTYVVNGIRGVYGELSAIDPFTNKQVGDIWIGRYPNGDAFGSAFDPVNGLFYITNPVAGTLAIFQTMGPAAITFKSAGLGSGASWMVTFDGVEAQSTNSTIQFNQQNGTYSYDIQYYNGYYPLSPTKGNITINGGPITITIHFISIYYLVTLIVGIPAFLGIAAFLILRRRKRG